VLRQLAWEGQKVFFFFEFEMLIKLSFLFPSLSQPLPSSWWRFCAKRNRSTRRLDPRHDFIFFIFIFSFYLNLIFQTALEPSLPWFMIDYSFPFPTTKNNKQTKRIAVEWECPEDLVKSTTPHDDEYGCTLPCPAPVYSVSPFAFSSQILNKSN